MSLEKGTKPNPLGKNIGISSGVLTKWKDGAIPNGETLFKIAEALDCSVDYLLGRTDNPQSHTSEEPDAQSTLISLIKMLTPEQQELVAAQIKGILAAQKSNPLSDNNGQD